MTSLESIDARSRWLEATKAVSVLEGQLFQPGGGYGCLEAKEADVHRLESARLHAERSFAEYEDHHRRAIDDRLFALHRSQTRATWASFAVAAAVGFASVASIILSLLN